MPTTPTHHGYCAAIAEMRDLFVFEWDGKELNSPEVQAHIARFEAIVPLAPVEDRADWVLGAVFMRSAFPLTDKSRIPGDNWTWARLRLAPKVEELCGSRL